MKYYLFFLIICLIRVFIMKIYVLLTTFFIFFLKSHFLFADNKSGRFFEDQSDQSEYNVHILYVLAKDSVDREYDVSGWIEKTVLKINNDFLKMTARNKKSNKIGQEFILDLTKDGKLDVTFMRMNISLQDLKKLKSEANQKIYQHVHDTGFNNPKKTYIIFTDFEGNGSSDHGLPYSIIFTPTMIGYGEPTTSKIILKTFIQAQGAAYVC